MDILERRQAFAPKTVMAAVFAVLEGKDDPIVGDLVVDSSADLLAKAHTHQAKFSRCEQSSLRALKHFYYKLFGDRWETLQKLIQSVAPFEIIKEGIYRHTRPLENRFAAQNVWIHHN